jgi:sialate O-acetylesterase
MTEQLTLAATLGDHMVLQRGAPLVFRGAGTPGELVTLSWATERGLLEGEARVDALGSWRLTVGAQPAGGPYQLCFQCRETVWLSDVWVGELWLASGQSNMEWTVAQSAEAEQELALATEPRLRWLFVERRALREAAAEPRGEWRVVTPDTAPRMTAIGYAFARRLCAELNVAVGIVDASWGGTPLEAWSSHESLAPHLDLPGELAAWEGEERDLDVTRAAHAETLRAWERRYLVQDDSNRGQADGWHRAEPSWDAPTLSVPTLWQRHGLAFNGAVWFRRELMLPADWVSPSTLVLGRIDDFDHTYVNGELVGSHPQGTPYSCDIERRYPVPAELLRAGRNVLTVRVFDHVGEGGFLDPPSRLYLESATGQRLLLAGPWQYRVERAVPLVPGSVWAEYPSTPRALRPQDRPASLFLGMIAPLLPLALRGVLWYQGEANVAQHAVYARRFAALVQDWQGRFTAAGDGAVWFLFAQLASFRASEDWALLREAQSRALSCAHTGMVVTLDIGDPDDIHPRNKREVGRRLALVALERAYGRQVGPTRGPLPTSIEFNGGAASVAYAGQAALGTTDGGAAVSGFELETADGAVHPLSAQLEGTSVRVLLPLGVEPRWLRYAFRDVPEINLVNVAGLPAEPFRVSVGAS